MKKDLNHLVSGLAFLIVIICFNSNIYAQRIDAIPLTTALTANQNQTFNNVTLNNLTKGMVPAIYVNNGLIENPNSSSETPIKIVIDASSLNMLNQSNSYFSDITAIEIKLRSNSELNLLRTIVNFNQFPNLKVIYFSCTFELCGANGTETCQKQTLGNSMNQISTPNLVAVYTVALDN